MLQIFIGALLISFAPIMVLLLSTSESTTAFYRCFISSLILFAIIFVRKGMAFFSKERFLSMYRPICLSGIFFALDLFVWHRSIEIIGAGRATILGNTQVFYASMISIIFLGEKLSLRFLVSVGMAFIGLYFLIVFNVGSSSLGENYWEGVLYGGLTGLFYSGFIFFLRQANKSDEIEGRMFNLAFVCFFASILLFVIASFENTLGLPKGMDFLWFFILTAMIQVLGWIFITNNLSKVSFSKASLLLLTQPTLATVWGVILFSEPITVVQALGAFVTMFAIYLGSTTKLT